MLPGHDGPVRNILANCQALEIEADPATTNVVWSTSVATACVIVAVHVSRLFMMENSPSELVVCVTAMTGVAWFLKDVYNCNLQWGMARLMGCLIIANCIVPRLFAHTDVVVRVKVEDDDDEMDDRGSTLRRLLLTMGASMAHPMSVHNRSAMRWLPMA